MHENIIHSDFHDPYLGGGSQGLEVGLRLCEPLLLDHVRAEQVFEVEGDVSSEK